MARFSNYALDNFVGFQLSLLTECGAKPIDEAPTWLAVFVLNSTLSATKEPKAYSYSLNFLRRAEGAVSSYISASLALSGYTNSSASSISQYFRALFHLESSIAQLWMADTLIAKLGGTRPFEPKSGSFEERLYAIYNASKHAENKIASGTMPVGAPVPVWITNRGIECSEALVSFAELEEKLHSIREFADGITMLKEAPK
jgi:hypothetical protein